MATSTMGWVGVVACLLGCSSVADLDEAAAAEAADGAPAWLSETGLYDESGKLAADVVGFEPAHPLWSDGASKRRFVKLPLGATIDTSDMDHWSLPVGTRLWKEIATADARIETRYIERLDEGPDGFAFAAYRWNEEGTDAERVLEGAEDAFGLGYRIPSAGECLQCHGTLDERVLGFSAVQLDHDGEGPTVRQLVEEGRLSHPPSSDYAVPGDATAAAALGYLHGNCGHCHNDAGVTSMHLRLSVAETTVEATAAFRTAVGVPSGFQHPGIEARIDPGHPESSAVHYRMSVRGDGQMPLVGTNNVDPDGLAAVANWIASLD